MGGAEPRKAERRRAKLEPKTQKRLDFHGFNAHSAAKSRAYGAFFTHDLRALGAKTRRRPPGGHWRRETSGDLPIIARVSLQRNRACVSASPHAFFGSTCPPKPLRIAEMIFSANVCCLRERKRV